MAVAWLVMLEVVGGVVAVSINSGGGTVVVGSCVGDVSGAGRVVYYDGGCDDVGVVDIAAGGVVGGVSCGVVVCELWRLRVWRWWC